MDRPYFIGTFRPRLEVQKFVKVPNIGAKTQDDFSSTKRYILDVVHVGKLIKSNTIHNFAEMNGIVNISLIS